MGYKTIVAKQAELNKQLAIRKTFESAVSKINAGLAKIEKSVKELEQTKSALAAEISGLNTAGVKEFEDYKKSLLAICNGQNFCEIRPMPMTPVNKVIQNSEDEIKDMLNAWVEKATAAMPKDIKPGMVFKNVKLNRFYEIASGPTQATNPNLKGDEAVWFSVKVFEGERAVGTLSISRSELSPQKGVKFVRV